MKRWLWWQYRDLMMSLEFIPRYVYEDSRGWRESLSLYIADLWSAIRIKYFGREQ
jgi:hypothetical protein